MKRRREEKATAAPQPLLDAPGSPKERGGIQQQHGTGQETEAQSRAPVETALSQTVPQTLRDVVPPSAKPEPKKAKGTTSERPKSVAKSSSAKETGRPYCGSETSLQQHLHKQRLLHQLQLTEKLLQPIRRQSGRTQAKALVEATGCTTKPSEGTGAAATAAETELGRTGGAIDRSGAATRHPSPDASIGDKKATPQSPQGRSPRIAASVLSMGTNPADKQSRDSVLEPHHVQGGVLPSELSASHCQNHPLQHGPPRERPDTLQQPEEQGGSRSPQARQTALKKAQSSQSETLKATKELVHHILLRQHEQLRQQRMQQSLEQGQCLRALADESERLAGFLTARDLQRPCGRQAAPSSQSQRPDRTLQSLLSPRCSIGAATLRAQGTLEGAGRPGGAGVIRPAIGAPAAGTSLAVQRDSGARTTSTRVSAACRQGAHLYPKADPALQIRTKYSRASTCPVSGPPAKVDPHSFGTNKPSSGAHASARLQRVGGRTLKGGDVTSTSTPRATSIRTKTFLTARSTDAAATSNRESRLHYLTPAGEAAFNRTPRVQRLRCGLNEQHGQEQAQHRFLPIQHSGTWQGRRCTLPSEQRALLAGRQQAALETTQSPSRRADHGAAPVHEANVGSPASRRKPPSLPAVAPGPPVDANRAEAACGSFLLRRMPVGVLPKSTSTRASIESRVARGSMTARAGFGGSAVVGARSASGATSSRLPGGAVGGSTVGRDSVGAVPHPLRSFAATKAAPGARLALQASTSARRGPPCSGSDAPQRGPAGVGGSSRSAIRGVAPTPTNATASQPLQRARRRSETADPLGSSQKLPPKPPASSAAMPASGKQTTRLLAAENRTQPKSARAVTSTGLRSAVKEAAAGRGPAPFTSSNDVVRVPRGLPASCKKAPSRRIETTVSVANAKPSDGAHTSRGAAGSAQSMCSATGLRSTSLTCRRPVLQQKPTSSAQPSTCPSAPRTHVSRSIGQVQPRNGDSNCSTANAKCRSLRAAASGAAAVSRPCGCTRYQATL